MSVTDMIEYGVGMYRRGKNDAIKDVMNFLHDEGIVSCRSCPYHDNCDVDCWERITRGMEEWNEFSNKIQAKDI